MLQIITTDAEKLYNRVGQFCGRLRSYVRVGKNE
jgi:hypothetical protein